MIEQETVLALIEAKEALEKAADYLMRAQLDEHGEVLEPPHRAHMRVTHALALIESILARGR